MISKDKGSLRNKLHCSKQSRGCRDRCGRSKRRSSRCETGERTLTRQHSHWDPAKGTVQSFQPSIHQLHKKPQACSHRHCRDFPDSPLGTGKHRQCKPSCSHNRLWWCPYIRMSYHQPKLESRKSMHDVYRVLRNCPRTFQGRRLAGGTRLGATLLPHRPSHRSRLLATPMEHIWFDG